MKRPSFIIALLCLAAVAGGRCVSTAVAAPPTQGQLELMASGEAQRVGAFDGGTAVTVTAGGAVYMVACTATCTICTFGSATSSSLDGGCDTSKGETFSAGEKRFIITGSSTTQILPAAACNCAVYRMR